MAIIRVKLKQWTPLLHFQADQSGACLRATEVKPKLDRFVAQFLEGQGIEVPKAWKLDAPEGRHHIPLKYKLRLMGSGVSTSVHHPLYFGKDAEVKAMTYADGITLTILPMTTARLEKVVALHAQQSLANPTLGELIRELLPPFFALHCFGARSGKGFGSFDVEDTAPLSDEALHYYAPKDCAAMYRLITTRDCLNEIYILSAMMKGGFNSPYYKGSIQKALWDHGMGSDKAFVKQMIFRNATRPNGEPLYDWYISTTKAHTSEPDYREYTGYRYLRAMLGLAGNYIYRKRIPGNNHGESEIINVSVEPLKSKYKGQIQRFANPVRFKPCQGGFRILVYQIPGVLRTSTFVFKYKMQRDKSYRIKMPSEEELNLVAFVNDFLSPLKPENKDLGKDFTEEAFIYINGSKITLKDDLNGLDIASTWTRESEGRHDA